MHRRLELEHHNVYYRHVADRLSANRQVILEEQLLHVYVKSQRCRIVHDVDRLYYRVVPHFQKLFRNPAIIALLSRQLFATPDCPYPRLLTMTAA